MDIIKYPNDILNQVCVDVSPEDMNESLQKTMDDMIELMLSKQGIGLSAPQIGVSKRYCVVHIPHFDTPPIYIINPIIKEHTDDIVKFEESCLSFPEMIKQINRYSSIIVSCLNRDFKSTTLRLNGLFAICVQHEIDHLDGITINDKRQ